MKELPKLIIQKVSNGFIVGEWGGYSDLSKQQVFTCFGDAIRYVSEMLGEKEFASTVIDASALTASLQKLCETAIAPKLLALEAKVNPGIENVVEKDNLPF